MASVFDYNPVIRLEDGYLAGLVESKDVSQNAQALRDFDEFCRENGAELIYINFPTKICKVQDENVLDYANENADRLLSMLREFGVKCYDFREFLHDDGMNHHASFFVTDHHWKPETGLWAAGRVLRLLRDDYGWPVDPEILNPENFDYVVYRDWFLGSQGKKFTLSRTKAEDISLIYPKFQTLLNYEVPRLGLNVSGDFSVTYDMSYIETKDYDTQNPYAAYEFGIEAMSRLHNLLNDNWKKVLFIRDSFSRCVMPFVALSIQQTDEIDVRVFNGSVRSFIASEKPDAVLVCYFASYVGAEQNVYDFN